MRRIIHFTHNDSDAIGCDVVLRLAFNAVTHSRNLKFETFYVGNPNVNTFISKVLSDNESANDIDYIFVSDIGPSEEVCKQLEEFRDSHNLIGLYGFDHHITNHNEEKFRWFKVRPENYIEEGDYFSATNISKYTSFIEDYRLKIMSKKISAAMVLFIEILTNLRTEIEMYNATIANNTDHELSLSNYMNYIFGLIYAISRYDTWEWMENPSREHNENLCSRILSVYKFSELSNSIVERVTDTILDPIYRDNTDECGVDIVIANTLIPERYFTTEQLAAYDVILRQFSMEKEKLGKNLRIATEQKYRSKSGVIGIEKSFAYYGYYIPTDFKFISEMSDYINKQVCNGKLEMVVTLYPQSTTLSLRTCQENVDVSMIAEGYGGGGHKKAAGAKLTNENFLRLYKKYLESTPYDEIDKSIFDD